MAGKEGVTVLWDGVDVDAAGLAAVVLVIEGFVAMVVAVVAAAFGLVAAHAARVGADERLR